uniref:HAT C-terminal dimerisation domain-containing protein n=1 Tax=Solanum lycopersicum TaxID=4081 RepID=A0A3Q7FLC9_SOLLC
MMENRGKEFPKLVPMTQDILAMQALSVASEGVFSAARFQLGEHRHSLAVDNLEISVLFRDWINAERRNLGREPLPTKFQDDVDEVMQDYSDDDLGLTSIVVCWVQILICKSCLNLSVEVEIPIDGSCSSLNVGG